MTLFLLDRKYLRKGGLSLTQMEPTRIIWVLLPAGCSGLFRNSDGRWNKGYSRKIGTCDTLSAEMWGIYLGM
jgi:hypothetical protein